MPGVRLARQNPTLQSEMHAKSSTSTWKTWNAAAAPSQKLAGGREMGPPRSEMTKAGRRKRSSHQGGSKKGKESSSAQGCVARHRTRPAWWWWYLCRAPPGRAMARPIRHCQVRAESQWSDEEMRWCQFEVDVAGCAKGRGAETLRDPGD